MYETILDILNLLLCFCSLILLHLSTAWSIGLFKCLLCSLVYCLSNNLRRQFSPSGKYVIAEKFVILKA